MPLNFPEERKIKAIGTFEVEDRDLYERIRTASEVAERNEEGHLIALADIFMLYYDTDNYYLFAEEGQRITEFYPLLIRGVDYGWAYRGRK